MPARILPLLLTVVLVVCHGGAQAADTTKRPNIVIILADDKCNSLIGRDSESRKYTVFLPYSGESEISNDQSN